jgi:hypothetical protein
MTFCLQHRKSVYSSHSQSGRLPAKSFVSYQGVYHIVILALCIGILIVAFLLKVGETGLSLFGFNWPLHCFLYETFGIKCALCGMTRSFSLMAHGNILESIRLHHFGPAVFIFTCLQIPYRIGTVTIFPEQFTNRWSRVNLYVAILICSFIFFDWLIYLGGLFI